MPRVTVIIPSYNSAETLPRAIDSVISQSVDDCEIIVVDDASTDDTKAVVTEYDDSRIQYIAHDKNRGGSAARNTGIDAAQGEYIAFLDADDEWLPQKLEIQIDALESRTDEWVAAHCNRTHKRALSARIGYKLARIIGARKSEPMKEGGKDLIKEVLMGYLSPGASTLLVESETVAKMGGFDADFPRHQDWEFLIRILKHGKLAHVDEPLVVKHGTGRPNADVYVDAKDKLLTVFSDDVERLENEGYPITHIQEIYLAKLYLEDGKYKKGLRRLSFTELSIPQFLSIAWSFSLGITDIWSVASKGT